MESKGIVILAGGPLYFLNAYINCVMLRRLGCKLPIEWFYLGEEMTSQQLAAIQEIDGVKLVDLGGDKRDNSKDAGGWQNKINAILASTFDEILWLDADCFPIRDPEYMLHHPFFQETGCVLFPDPNSWNECQLDLLNKRFNVTLPALQVESGQMMFRKSACMDGLLCVKKLNDNHQEVYQHIYGDKDTFLIGMLQAGSPFRVSPHRHRSMTMGMMHKDFEGQELFCHLAGGKFRLHGRPFISTNDYVHLDQAREIHRGLKERNLI